MADAPRSLYHISSYARIQERKLIRYVGIYINVCNISQVRTYCNSLYKKTSHDNMDDPIDVHITIVSLSSRWQELSLNLTIPHTFYQISWVSTNRNQYPTNEQKLFYFSNQDTLIPCQCSADQATKAVLEDVRILISGCVCLHEPKFRHMVSSSPSFLFGTTWLCVHSHSLCYFVHNSYCPFCIKCRLF